ncbi:MAG TPA: DNA polymerase III subunit gamma/tau [Anaerolineae bacterium]|nr:DNA polymerase III subunit gamma/tau [Anaerolineae bacterium]
MATQALYRKWRPQTYEEISGQEHVTRTLRNALEAGRIGHAYLFAGPRGTGKTSMARILAKAVNCLSEEVARPCNKCALCQSLNEGRLLDLIEIDAASNRGIDEVRDLRDKIGFVPNESRYKVYILDEAHMLTEPAFNALLKTLEEPPAHVIFVLVTTEPHKIPLTIQSRCQRLDFRRVPRNEIISRLEHIAREEGLDVEEAALDAITAQATGSMRDAISLLDQLRSYGTEEITLTHVRAVLGGVGDQAVQEFVGHLVASDVPAGLDFINHLISQGVEIRQLLSEVVEYLRQLLLVKVGAGTASLNVPAETGAALTAHAGSVSQDYLLRTIRLFNQASRELKGGTQSQLPLELAFIEAAGGSAELATKVPAYNVREAAVSPQTRLGPKPATGQGRQAEPTGLPRAAAPTAVPASPSPSAHEPAAAQGRQAETTRGTAAPAPAAAAASPSPGPSVVEESPQPSRSSAAVLEDLQGRWHEVLATVRLQSFKAEAALRSSCQPVAIEDGLVTLAFGHEFPKQMIEDPEHLSTVEQAVSGVLGKPLKMRCMLMSDLSVEGSRRAPRRQRAAVPATPAATQDEAVESAQAAEPAESTDPAQETKYESSPAAEEPTDPVVQEAVESYGAKVVRVTQRR